MAKFKFWRTLGRKKRRKSRSAPQLPEFTGMAVSARRMNRLVAAVTIVGACGTVALAVALTPGAQTTASNARAAQGALEIGRMTPEPIRIQKVSLPATVTAALPEPVLEAAPKTDRLVPAPTPQAVGLGQPRVVDLRGPVGDEGPEEPAEAAAGPDYLTPAVAEPKFEAESEPEQERGVELALSDPPAPGAPSEESASGPLLDDIEEAIEDASEDGLEEVPDPAVAAPAADVVEEPAPEGAAEAAPERVAVARTATVRSDVNLRAGPDNGAAVITVVRRNRNVELIGCDYWCEVVYEGRRGFIYKSFVRRTDS